MSSSNIRLYIVVLLEEVKLTGIAGGDLSRIVCCLVFYARHYYPIPSVGGRRERRGGVVA